MISILSKIIESKISNSSCVIWAFFFITSSYLCISDSEWSGVTNSKFLLKRIFLDIPFFINAAMILFVSTTIFIGPAHVSLQFHALSYVLSFRHLLQLIRSLQEFCPLIQPFLLVSTVL